MSEHADETQDTQDGVDDSATGDADATGTEVTPAWSGPSQEDWTKFQERQEALVRRLDELFTEEEEEEEPDYSQLDLSDPNVVRALIDARVNQSLQQITPTLRASAEEQGRKVMEGIFTELDPKGDAFDRELAERAAYSFASQGLDPESAVREGAKYATEYRKREREAVTPKRRGPADVDDPSLSSSARPGQKPPSSYDEAIDRWSKETEV